MPNKIDYIYHTAAIRDSFLSNKKANNQILDNFRITQNLIDFSLKIKCKYFIYLSSVYIYSGSLKNKFIENQVNIPVESLGLSKYICETALKKHRMILILNVSHLDYLQSMDLIPLKVNLYHQF